MPSLRKDANLIRNLVTFEVASRALNFTHAARELGVSRVAVSRQIADLERDLQTRLFARNHRNVSLTKAGEALASSVSPGLNMIADGLQLVRGQDVGNRLSITTTTAFATYWLMPRLGEFNALHPDVDVNLVVSDKYLDLEDEGIDIAIRYDRKPPTIGKVTRLQQEQIFPVFSPKYNPVSKMRKPADFLQERLLQLAGHYRPETGWQHWFNVHHTDHGNKKPFIMVNTYINVLQAAIEGQGIALAGYPLVNSFLEDGTLLASDCVPPLVREYFYLVNCSGKDPKAAAFSNWMVEQATA